MAAPLKEIGSTAAKATGSFRETVQDLLVPEFRALKVTMESIRTEMQLRDERQTHALEALTNEMRLRDEQQSKTLSSLSQKLDFAIDIRERLAAVEARLPRQ